ncbi:MAG: ABC transporter permease subunit [Phycisphaerae bacterium]|nr:ABC transporter permease subunit [Phycisphaerae bacterium]MDD5381389.1 ABC transporter permease subunit [Phycisphaerae bacterium]
MHKKLFTIAKNTFIETLRQPVYAVIIFAALFLFFISPSLTMYTMSDDNKLLREVGLSTLFLASLFIAIFSASGAVAEEIENKTITTVLTKPVQRPIFIIAKFFGVSAAVALAHYICTIALLMAIRHGVMLSVNDTTDWTVVGTAAVVFAAAFLLSAFFNYVYDWKFSSTAIVLLGMFATVGIIFLYFIDRNWQFNPKDNGINTLDVYGAILLLLAALIIVALAVAFSARFNIMVTLSACIGIFLLGLISDYTFGRFAETQLWAQIGRLLVPNLQVFWISDAIYEGSEVPLKYILISASYASCYTIGILALAVAFFQRRQVG